MSIRLRLTLTYTTILALTLIIFSSLLYFFQVRVTLNTVQTRLASNFLSEAGGPGAPPRNANEQNRPRPRGPIVFFQLRNPDGTIFRRDPQLGSEVTLPLSDTALQRVRQGETWTEMTIIDGERFMVRSHLARAPNDQPRIVQTAASLIDRDQYLETLGRVLIIGSSLAVLAAFGIGWVLAGLALRPINRLQQTAQTIGAERDFNRRVDYQGPKDEIGQLATTFNGMLGELQAAFLQVEQSLATQQRFVADASHELRTPLTTLRGNIALLQRRPPLNLTDQEDILADMESEAERLIRLVNDLLVLARADAKRPLRHESVNLRPLLSDVCQQIRVLAPTRQLKGETETDLTILGDRDALKQVLLILLDNALKHTPSESSISLSSRAVNQQALLIIRDNGPGIKPSLIPHIFDRFTQGNTARSSSGAGLGLAIAKELLEAQGGTITVESEVGQGTVFTLRFPLAQTM
jgi:signal transduction histidine kinase